MPLFPIKACVVMNVILSRNHNRRLQMQTQFQAQEKKIFK
jgi:hypothetical protein